MSSSYYSLARAFTASDFKLRYHGSMLGVFWAFLKPLLLFGVLYTVFSVFMRFPIPYYGLYLLLGIILWNFFVEATTYSMKSFIAKGPFIRKVHFPRSILVVAATIIALVNLGLNLIVFFVFFAFAGPALTPVALSFFVWVLELYLFSLGVAFALSALNAKYRDIEHLWDVVVPMGFWVTPIVYSLAMVPVHYQPYFAANPLAGIIGAARDSLLSGTGPGFATTLLLTILVALVAAGGYAIFRTRSLHFAEEL
jgi:ABC-type polysaccharide/polyol phosphate export permease